MNSQAVPVITCPMCGRTTAVAIGSSVRCKCDQVTLRAEPHRGGSVKPWADVDDGVDLANRVENKPRIIGWK